MAKNPKDRFEHVMLGLLDLTVIVLSFKFAPFWVASWLCLLWLTYSKEFKEGQAKGWYFRDYRGNFWGTQNLKFAFLRTLGMGGYFLIDGERMFIKDPDARDTAWDTWLPPGVYGIVCGVLQYYEVWL